MSTKMQIQKNIASLESSNDQLISEILYIDQLLKTSGFPEGLTSLKSVAQEMLHLNFDGEVESEDTEDESLM